MPDVSIKNKGQGQIFNNKWLEYLTKASPQVSAGIYIAIGLVLLYIGYSKDIVDSFLAGAAIFVGALLFWTFFEYVFHRYINHIDEYFPDSKWAHKLAYIIHGIHHEYRG